MQRFSVGRRIDGRNEEPVTVEADDALDAAVRVQRQAPGATITYVRKSHRRGDRRHPRPTGDTGS
jgi:hypothetical protein